MIQRGINYSSDPCDNFYNYGCGSWAANNPIPPSALYWNTDEVYVMKINQRLKEILEERSKYDELPPVQKLKQYYRSCMDKDAIEKEGLEPMMTMLDATGGWPIIMENEGTNLENLTWQDIDNAYTQNYGISSFFGINYEPDDEDSNRNILTINIDGTSSIKKKLYSEEISLPDPELTEMEEIIKAFAKYKGTKINEEKIDKEIEDLFLFGDKLDQINWLQTIQSIYNNVNVSINASRPVNVYNKKLLHKLAYLLDETSPRILDIPISEIQDPYFAPGMPLAFNYGSVGTVIGHELTHSFDSNGQMIQRGINYSSDPCDNFYNYGCGSWAANNPMPPSALYWNTDKVYIMKINRRLKELLEERSKHDKLPPIRKLKQYYRSCMDEDAIEKEGLEPMMTMLDATGGWPIIMENEGTNLENYTWQDIDNAYIPIFGFSSFVDISYEPDDENSNYNILMINIDKISLTENKLYSERVLFSNPDLTKMEEIIKAFAKYKGAKINTNRMDKEIEDLFLFEEKFKDIIRKSYENVFKGLEINRTKMTISELQEYYDLAKTENTTSKINWLQTLQSVYNSVNVSINASEPVNVYNKKLLHKLAYLLDATSPRILVNFVQWNIVYQFVSFLTKSVRDIDFKSTHEKYNVTEQKPRWETCVQEIPFQNALSYLYVKNYNITHNIKAAWCGTSRNFYEEDYINNDVHTFPRFRTIGSASNFVSFSKVYNCSVNSPMNRQSKCNLWK
ncbi:Endothelin-converting enzyme 1 [Harpegnathos saltator]|uniref:Endothelin-converting enzyme 1 n=1 Tax=Harpegnathos saltator TaxID=610380 RepID=E2BAD3_HARSA|nr:Endothelin-converting enzyme 1 [Harpegnathos saltator]